MMGFLRDLIEHGFPALSASAAAAPKASEEIAQLVRDFREERANDIASIADRAGRNGARLAIMQSERDAWQAYAKKLEKLCLSKGLDMPQAPDEAPLA